MKQVWDSFIYSLLQIDEFKWELSCEVGFRRNARCNKYWCMQFVVWSTRKGATN